jgi:hypothetical protein
MRAALPTVSHTSSWRGYLVTPRDNLTLSPKISRDREEAGEECGTELNDQEAGVIKDICEGWWNDD